MMDYYVADMYEDNAGRLHVFVYREDMTPSRETSHVLWGGMYDGQEREAARDWVALLNGADPSYWDCGGYGTNVDVTTEQLTAYWREADEAAECNLVASSVWVDSDDRLGIIPDMLGSSGRIMARAACELLGIDADDYTEEL